MLVAGVVRDVQRLEEAVRTSGGSRVTLEPLLAATEKCYNGFWATDAADREASGL